MWFGLWSINCYFQIGVQCIAIMFNMVSQHHVLLHCLVGGTSVHAVFMQVFMGTCVHAFIIFPSDPVSSIIHLSVKTYMLLFFYLLLSLSL